MNAVFLNLNWLLDSTPIAVDTSRPPKAPPLEWLYVADFFKKNRLNSTLIDAYAIGQSIEQTICAISTIRPDCIFISSTPSYLYWRCPPLNLSLVRRYIDAINNSGIEAVTVVVGPHGTRDRNWVKEISGASYVITGEIDHPGITRVAQQPRDLPLDFGQQSTLPQVAYDLDLSCYEPHAWPRKVRQSIFLTYPGNYATVEFTRGCHHDCSFCLRSGFRKSLRAKSVEFFRKEIRQLADMNVSYVFFIDENFGQPLQRFLEACSVLEEHHIKFGFQCRPEIFLDSRIERIVELGAIYAEIGLESDDASFLSKSGKFQDPEKAIFAAERAKELVPWCSINAFDVSRVSMDLDLNSRFDREGRLIAPMIPYPGTVVGDDLISQVRQSGIRASCWEIAEAIFIYWSIQAGVECAMFADLARNGDWHSAIKRILLILSEKHAKPGSSTTRFYQGPLNL